MSFETWPRWAQCVALVLYIGTVSAVLGGGAWLLWALSR